MIGTGRESLTEDESGAFGADVELLPLVEIPLWHAPRADPLEATQFDAGPGAPGSRTSFSLCATPGPVSGQDGAQARLRRRTITGSTAPRAGPTTPTASQGWSEIAVWSTVGEPSEPLAGPGSSATDFADSSVEMSTP